MFSLLNSMRHNASLLSLFCVVDGSLFCVVDGFLPFKSRREGAETTERLWLWWAYTVSQGMRQMHAAFTGVTPTLFLGVFILHYAERFLRRCRCAQLITYALTSVFPSNLISLTRRFHATSSSQMSVTVRQACAIWVHWHVVCNCMCDGRR